MSNDPQPVIAYITTGAAGMYCGSCMHDNTLVRALIQSGLDVQLIPAYTPIRTDEKNISSDKIFFGGINVYLQQKIPLFRHLPGFLDRVLDQPWLIRRLTAKAVEMKPSELGSLTVSMLRGTSGFQRKEVKRLCHWLKHSVKPDVIVLTNVLIAGCVPEFKRTFDVPVIATLQGDDIFLESLPQPFQKQAVEEIRRLVTEIDGFICHSQYYADFMRDYIGVPSHKLHITPLGIDTDDFQHLNIESSSSQSARTEAADADADSKAKPLTIGYLARQAPEKGLHHLVDAFIELRKRTATQEVRLCIAGWIGSHNQKYIDQQHAKLDQAGLSDAYENRGTVDRQQKIKFFESIDVLSVPTTYHEPKGLFVLESLAAGVPVVLPNHGAFPEVLQSTNGGLLCQPDDGADLADQLELLLTDPKKRRELGRQGQLAIFQNRNQAAMAKSTRAILSKYCDRLPSE